MPKNKYSKDDFTAKAEVRWCPGCGDYAILAALQRTLPELGLPPERHVFVSGIGCAGRLPYYMNTYGYHTIHGRALPVATGIKAFRDDLTVWVITGDGDALSIGGNHLLHCLRRNVNIKILLINNEVYGLTKGQFSPTSHLGQITKTSPHGVMVPPVNPLALALSAGASFVARAVDKDPNHLGQLLKQAHAHQGCALIEIKQDCHIFNPNAFDEFSLKTHRAERTIELQDGKPLLFGQNKERSLIWQDEAWQQGTLDNTEVYQHETSNYIKALRLANLDTQSFPVPLGVYFQKERPVFKIVSSESKTKKTHHDLSALFRAKNIWQIKSED
ncbi:MAG: 2-oxoacid:ferredoxin oxidoreductase subunit beta [Gammaproteobacteria bacterium]